MKGTAPGPLAGERFHLLGIAGRGMAPLAVAARHLGAEVDGCDRAGVAEIHDFLVSAGITYARDHDVSHVHEGTTHVATSVATSDLPEMAAVGARCWHRSDLLARVLSARRSLGVTGSHGKGTVATLTTGALARAGLDPLAVLGILVHDFDGMARLGSGPVVAEVDDSDLSLARVTTDVAVVTNLDEDHPHLDISLRAAVQGVGEYVAKARDRVVLGPSPRAAALAAVAEAPVWTYGRDFRGRTVSARAGETVLDLNGPGGERERAVVRLLGPRTNVNAALAFVSALALGAEPAAAAAGLGDIGAMSRRLQHLGSPGGVHVFDDFGGKHPIAVREGIRALRAHYPSARITAVLEPYGPYLSRWGRRYARALGHADRVVLAPAVFHADYDAGRPFDEGWVNSCRVEPVLARDRDDAAAVARRLSEPGDVIVFFAQIHSAREMAEGLVARAAR